MEVSGRSQGGLNLNTNTDMFQTTFEEIKVPSVNEANPSVKVTENDVSKAVDKFNSLIEEKGTYAQYEVYGKSHNITIRILDNKTNRVIKEIPPKKLIDMIDKFCEMAGVLVDEKV